MPCDCPQLRIWSPRLKLNEPRDGSVASHFISLPGVTMSNWAAASELSALLLMSPVVMAVPKYRPCASASVFTAVAACAGADAPAANAATDAASNVVATVPPMLPPVVGRLLFAVSSSLSVVFSWERSHIYSPILPERFAVQQGAEQICRKPL